ncbi:MAG: DUF1580 domain-containing protein [Pirellulales bacterium]
MRDDLIPFSVVPKHVPGTRPNIATIWRWRQRGVAGIRLPVCHVGGRVYVSLADLALWMEQVQAAKEGAVLPRRTDKQRECAIAAAEKELSEAGI